jgi:molybdate transport system regulatory protein
MPRLTLRIDLDGMGSIGPGKVRLLEGVAGLGSIRGAAGVLKMSYARAWSLIQELNATFGEPVLSASAGGKAGGGAQLTALGHEIVASYRAAEAKAARAAKGEITKLNRRAKPRRPGGRQPKN